MATGSDSLAAMDIDPDVRPFAYTLESLSPRGARGGPGVAGKHSRKRKSWICVTCEHHNKVDDENCAACEKQRVRPEDHDVDNDETVTCYTCPVDCTAYHYHNEDDEDIDLCRECHENYAEIVFAGASFKKVKRDSHENYSETTFAGASRKKVKRVRFKEDCDVHHIDWNGPIEGFGTKEDQRMARQQKRAEAQAKTEERSQKKRAVSTSSNPPPGVSFRSAMTSEGNDDFDNFSTAAQGGVNTRERDAEVDAELSAAVAAAGVATAPEGHAGPKNCIFDGKLSSWVTGFEKGDILQMHTGLSSGQIYPTLKALGSQKPWGWVIDHLAKNHYQEFIAAIKSHYNLSSVSDAEVKLGDLRANSIGFADTSPKTPLLDRHRPLGNVCKCVKPLAVSKCNCPNELHGECQVRWQILNPGVWKEQSEASDEKRDTNQSSLLTKWVEEGTQVTSSDILRCVPDNCWCFRWKCWHVVAGARRIDISVYDLDTVELIDCTRGLAVSRPDLSAEYFVVPYCGVNICIKTAAQDGSRRIEHKGHMHKDHLLPIVFGALDPRSVPAPEIIAAYDYMAGEHPLTVGDLMSILQKSIRYGPETFLCPDGTKLNPSVCAAMATAILLHHRGFFNENLQQFVFGRTTAFKRVAVSQMEDGCPGVFEDTESAVARLLTFIALSLLTEQVADFFPPKVTQEFLILSAFDSVRCDMIMWRDKQSRGHFALLGESGKLKNVNVPPQVSDDLLRCVLCLNKRSFDTDVKMFRDCKRMVDKHGKLSLWRADPRNFPQEVPVYHYHDQHNTGNLHNLLNPDFASTHALIGRKVFTHVTGHNSTFCVNRGFEEQPTTIAVRECQLFIEKHRTGQLCVTNPPAPPLVTSRIEISCDVNPGFVSAALGAVHINLGKKRYIVILGTDHPNKLIAAPKPSRKEVDTEPLPPETESKLFAIMREKKFECKCPLLGKFGLRFDKQRETWLISTTGSTEEVTLEELTRTGVKSTLDVLSAHDLPRTLDDPSFLERCYRFNINSPACFVMGAKEAIERVCEGLDEKVIARTIELISNEFESVCLPSPSRDGGAKPNERRPQVGDWVVFRLLVFISAYVPAALKVSGHSVRGTFKVVNVAATKHVCGWLRAILNAKCEMISGINIWCRYNNTFDSITSCLKEWQKEVLGDCQTRFRLTGNANNFISAPTGSGKTVMNLAYILWLLLKTDLGKRARMIFMTAPKGDTSVGRGQVIESLITDIKKWGIDVHVPTWNKDTRSWNLVPGAVNLLGHDEGKSRKVRGTHDERDTVLANQLRRFGALSIFDEADRGYNDLSTLRCAFFFKIMEASLAYTLTTATAVVKNFSNLASILKPLLGIPINKKNEIVAFAFLTLMRNHCGKIEELIDEAIPRPKGLSTECLDGNWNATYKFFRDQTDPFLVDTAIKFAQEDRRSTPGGGVLLVADDSIHAAKLLSLAEQTILSRKILFRVGDVNTLTLPNTYEYGVVIMPKTVRAFNEGVRCGVTVAGVYPCDISNVMQYRGRINRVNQARDRVKHVRVFMENSFQSYLKKAMDEDVNFCMSLDHLGQINQSVM